jgi:hypothetical protein
VRRPKKPAGQRPLNRGHLIIDQTEGAVVKVPKYGGNTRHARNQDVAMSDGLATSPDPLVTLPRQGKLDEALALASAGWPVFPCVPNGKQPATAHGFKDANTDPDVIRSWWSRMPDANLAIATGAPGPDVLDVDMTDTGDGFGAMDRLKRAGLLRGALRLVRTPRSGLHLYFAGTDQGNRAHIGGHPLDFRGHGGYVLAPPSAVGGNPYVLTDTGAKGGPLDLAAVARLLMPPRKPRRSARRGGVAGLVRHVAKQAGGNRNEALHWAACRAVEEGHTDQLVS